MDDTNPRVHTHQEGMKILRSIQIGAKTSPHMRHWLSTVQLPYYAISGDDFPPLDTSGWEGLGSRIDDAIANNVPLEMSAGGLAFLITMTDTLRKKRGTDK